MLNVSAIFFWGAGSASIALLGLWVSKKAIKPIDLDKYGDLMLATVTIVGTLVSILLGLLVSESVGQYRALQSSVGAEANCIGDVFRLSRGLPGPAGDQLRALCIDYCEQVINDDWPAMRQGKASNIVSATYLNLSDTIVTFRPNNSGEATVQQALVAAASRAAEHRHERIAVEETTWTKRLLPILIMCAAIVLAFSYLYVRSGNILLHAVLVSLVAVVLGTNIGVIFLMGRAFASPWSIQPEPFESIVQYIKESKNRPSSDNTTH